MSAWKKIKQSQKKNDKLKRKWSQRINLSSSYTSKRQIIIRQIITIFSKYGEVGTLIYCWWNIKRCSYFGK